MVVYFPQGHIQHLLQFGDPELPFTLFSCCVCVVRACSYHFPHHLAPSSSIVCQLQLEVVAAPAPESQLHNAFVRSFCALPPSLHLPRVTVSLRDSDLPDFVFSYDRYTQMMARPWSEHDHFQMDFLNE